MYEVTLVVTLQSAPTLLLEQANVGIQAPLTWYVALWK